jgi:hypothetical protein
MAPWLERNSGASDGPLGSWSPARTRILFNLRIHRLEGLE